MAMIRGKIRNMILMDTQHGTEAKKEYNSQLVKQEKAFHSCSVWLGFSRRGQMGSMTWPDKPLKA